jgi:hypothetical protein
VITTYITNTSIGAPVITTYITVTSIAASVTTIALIVIISAFMRRSPSYA